MYFAPKKDNYYCNYYTSILNKHKRTQQLMQDAHKLCVSAKMKPSSELFKINIKNNHLGKR